MHRSARETAMGPEECHDKVSFRLSDNTGPVRFESFEIVAVPLCHQTAEAPGGCGRDLRPGAGGRCHLNVWVLGCQPALGGRQNWSQKRSDAPCGGWRDGSGPCRLPRRRRVHEGRLGHAFRLSGLVSSRPQVTMKDPFAGTLVVFAVSVVTAMTGRGGGSFYVPASLLALCKCDTRSSRPSTAGVRGREMSQ